MYLNIVTIYYIIIQYVCMHDYVLSRVNDPAKRAFSGCLPPPCEINHCVQAISFYRYHSSTCVNPLMFSKPLRSFRGTSSNELAASQLELRGSLAIKLTQRAEVPLRSMPNIAKINGLSNLKNIYTLYILPRRVPLFCCLGIAVLCMQLLELIIA